MNAQQGIFRLHLTATLFKQQSCLNVVVNPVSPATFLEVIIITNMNFYRYSIQDQE